MLNIRKATGKNILDTKSRVMAHRLIFESLPLRSLFSAWRDRKWAIVNSKKATKTKMKHIDIQTSMAVM